MAYKFTVSGEEKSEEKIQEFEFSLRIDDEGQLLLKAQNGQTGKKNLIFCVTTGEDVYIYRNALEGIGLPYNII